MPRLNQAERLLREAEAGKELTTDQRRHVVAYLRATQPDMNSVQMAEIFNCADRTIRDDWGVIRKQMAESIKSEDVGLVIADIRQKYEQFVERAEKSLKKASEGTAVYLQHLKLIMDMELKVVEAMQSLGYYPKNLGNLTSERFEYKAHVFKDGSVETRPVDAYDHLMTTGSSKEIEGSLRTELDHEFGQTPKALPPAPAETNGTEDAKPTVHTE